jgi:hypothetical protein
MLVGPVGPFLFATAADLETFEEFIDLAHHEAPQKATRVPEPALESCWVGLLVGNPKLCYDNLKLVMMTPSFLTMTPSLSIITPNFVTKPESR